MKSSTRMDIVDLPMRLSHFPLNGSWISGPCFSDGDITKWSCPLNAPLVAIVNPTNEEMLGGGGEVDAALHGAAGPGLKEACLALPEVQPGIRCPMGEAKITPGFNLRVSHVIHTAVPTSSDDVSASLLKAYRNVMLVAKENNIKHIAFPCISGGVQGVTEDEDATIAISIIKEFAQDFSKVYFILPTDTFHVWCERASRTLR